MLPQPRQGRAQVVGDAVGNPADVFHQALNPVEHPVEIFRDLIEVVVVIGQRHPARQVAGHDAARGLIDFFDLAGGPATENQPADRKPAAA